MYVYNYIVIRPHLDCVIIINADNETCDFRGHTMRHATLDVIL